MSLLDPVTLLILWGLMVATALAFALAGGIWSRLALFSSLSQKGALLLLVWSCWKEAPTMASVALLTLLVGGVSSLVLGLFLARRSG